MVVNAPMKDKSLRAKNVFSISGGTGNHSFTLFLSTLWFSLLFVVLLYIVVVVIVIDVMCWHFSELYGCVFLIHFLPGCHCCV